MTKQKIEIEYPLATKSPNIIWEQISSAHGLERWIADHVTEEDGVFTFTWGGAVDELEFSTGDKLWFRGVNDGGAGVFTALLTWQSGGKFSGNLYTQNEYKGTVDALLTVATDLQAYLLPAGYLAPYGFLSFYTVI